MTFVQALVRVARVPLIPFTGMSRIRQFCQEETRRVKDEAVIRNYNQLSREKYDQHQARVRVALRKAKAKALLKRIDEAITKNYELRRKQPNCFSEARLTSSALPISNEVGTINVQYVGGGGSTRTILSVSLNLHKPEDQQIAVHFTSGQRRYWKLDATDELYNSITDYLSNYGYRPPTLPSVVANAAGT